MNLIIAGGRDFNNYLLLEDKLIKLLSATPLGTITVLCGMAKGADSLGKRWAIFNGVKIKEFPADWGKYGKAAGHIRNKQMAEEATHLVAFWDGKSKGTKNMIETAQNMGLQVRVIKY